MEMILAILLYLHIIVSPGTYRKSEIDIHTQANMPRIMEVQSSQAEMDIVEREFLPLVKDIVILNDADME